MIKVVTTFSPTGWQEYGHHFFETFDKFWPSHVELVIYTESTVLVPKGSPYGRTITVLPLSSISGHADFILELSPFAKLNGRVPMSCWKAKDIADGYSFRTDVIKFSHKVASIWDAAHRIGSGTLVWCDADVRWLRPVPEQLVTEIMEGCDVAYLGRDANSSSECGFIGFRLPHALPFIDTWHEYYVDNKFGHEAQWHDSYLFDRARERCQTVQYRSMTTGRGHVWVRSPLAPFGDHLKGERKALGRSPEHRARFG